MKREDLFGLNIVEMGELIVAPSEPEPISMWPETEGWIWLSLLVICLCAWACYRWWKYRKANAYRRAALDELSRDGHDAAAVASILRRTALVAYPRIDVAALRGDAWLNFLNTSLGKPIFTSESGQALLLAPYRSLENPTTDLSSLARDWILHHKAEGAK